MAKITDATFIDFLFIILIYKLVRKKGELCINTTCIAHQVKFSSVYEIGISSNTTVIRGTEHSGWGARIRTRINGFKVRRATIAPRPKYWRRKYPGGLYCIICIYGMTMLEGFWENNQGLSQKNVTLSETLSLVGQTGGKGLKSGN